MGVSCCLNICSYFCEFNTMYHCIIVTFIKQTINILTFLTDMPSLLLSCLPLFLLSLSVGGIPCSQGVGAYWARGWGLIPGPRGTKVCMLQLRVHVPKLTPSKKVAPVMSNPVTPGSMDSQSRMHWSAWPFFSPGDLPSLYPPNNFFNKRINVMIKKKEIASRRWCQKEVKF